MLLDERTEFADALAVNTGGAADYVIGDQIDLGVAGRDLGLNDIWFVAQVDTALLSATGSFQISLAMDDNGSLSSPTKILTSVAKAQAGLTAGTTLIVAKLPSMAYERYLGIVQTTITAAFTAGKINAFLTDDPTVWRAYADAVN